MRNFKYHVYSSQTRPALSAKFHSTGNIFHFWDQGFWNACFNVECVLLGRNFDFLGGYCSLPNGYRWLLVVT